MNRATLAPPLSPAKRLRVTALVWLAMVGLDFLLNGAVFASIYQNGGTFILPPTEAFRRIPLGYLAFLMLAFSVVEIAHRLGTTHVVDGMRLGLAIGGVFGATWALSLYSIATLTAETAMVFAAVWLGLLALAGAVAASGLGRSSLRGLAFRVVAIDVICAATTIALQSLGLA